MKRPKLWILVFGAMMAMASVFSFLRATWIESHTRWELLNLPIHLRKGFHIEGAFMVDLPADDYEIEIVCRDTISEPSQPLFEELAVRYELLEDGKPLQTGKVPPLEGIAAVRNEWITAILCEFSGRINSRYRVAISVDQGSSSLESTKPTLVVRLDPTISKDLEGDMWIFTCIGWTTSIFAVCSLIYGLIILR